MDQRVCPKCGQEIEDMETKFCSNCGANLFGQAEPWICPKCGTENSADSLFCKACGNNRSKRTDLESSAKGKFLSIVQSKKFLFRAAIVIIMILGGLGSYYYFNSVNETKYLTAYAEAAREIEDANNILSSNIKADILKGNKSPDLVKQLQEQKTILDEEAVKFSQQKPFAGYESTHNNVTSLLRKESALFEQTTQLLNNPLDDSTDKVIEDMKENVNEIKTINTEINVPNASFVSSVDLSLVPQQLSVYIADQKQINRAKMEKLAAYQNFFKKMDNAIQQYDAARKELGTIREGFKKEGFMWNDYLNALGRAKSSRSSIRYTVSEIDPPAGTEMLKQQFLSVIDDAILYCDTLSAAGNLQRYNYHWQSDEKEKSANKINREVQNGYSAFMESYQSEKNRLTNVNNL